MTRFSRFPRTPYLCSLTLTQVGGVRYHILAGLLNHGGLFPIFKGLVNFGWFIFKWGVLPAAVVTIVALPYIHREVDREILCQVVERFARHYGDLEVNGRSAIRQEGRGIGVRGLSIREPGVEGPHGVLLDVEELFLCCTTDLARLATEEPQIAQITIRRPTLRVTRQPDGSWSSARLLPVPKLSARPPSIAVENATIEILDPTKTPPSTWTLRDVNLTVEPSANSGEGCDVRTLRGTLSGDHLGRVEFEGVIDVAEGRWSIAGMVDQLDVSPELRDALPAVAAEPLAVLGAFRGKAGLGFRIAGDSSSAEGPRFDVSGKVTQGRVDDPRLPYPLTNIRAAIRANNEGFAVDELFAQSGQSTLRLSCRRAGYAAASPWSAMVSTRQLELDQPLLASLPESMRAVWAKYSPSGRVDLDLMLVSDGKRLLPEQTEMTATFSDIGFAYEKFRYRVEHARGKLVLKNDVLVLGMSCGGDEPTIEMAAEVRQPLTAAHGWFEAKGHGMPIDRKLIDALDERSRHVVDSLHPQGTLDFSVRVWRDRPGEAPLQQIVLGLNGCSMRFDGFPYPLENVKGRMKRLADGAWIFEELKGTNDAGCVTCTGRVSNTADGDKLLELAIEGHNIQLEEELGAALKPAMQRVWDDFKPRGAVDVTAGVSWLAGRKKLNVEVVAQPRPETASIEPKAFPYRMEQLRGTMVYRDGHVAFERFQARHGDVTLSGGGYCDFLPDGSWQFHIEGIRVDRLRLDRELVQALPGQLRKGLVELNPSGPMYLSDGMLDLAHSGNPGDPPRASWRLDIGFQQASIDCGVRLENMFGGMRVEGRFDGGEYQTAAQLAIDSLTYRGLQFTDVAGPVWIDRQRVLLGSWVDRRDGGEAANAPPRPITARLFDGTIRADGWVALETSPRFRIQADLTQADLARFAKEAMPGQQDLEGKVGAQIDLSGRGRTLNGLQGHGRVWLRDGNVYELPVMIAMLKILSIREPNTTAFSKADVRFHINGNHIYLSPIDFNGDAISLLGQGQMDFQSNIKLAFHAVVGRNEFFVPIISPLMGEASRQTMTINVDGTLQNPRTSQEVLPGVKQALEQLEAELRPAASPRTR